MITQDFLMEFELALLKAYTKANKSSTQQEPNFVGTVRSQEQFMTAFIAGFQEQRSVLERHIQKGGHRDAARLFEKIQRQVETMMRSAWMRGMDEKTFKNAVRELKWDVRSTFYG
ncbi:hypothetical protein HYX14_04695 [Candidatus Woesearchaeota archaeon]|nr:hypothetical protein [Candidatus Woesearchaeota archaeon]